MVRILSVAVLVVIFVGACSLAPTTKAEVCTSFDELGSQFLSGNGIIGNPLFHKAGDLAGIVGRYDNGSLKSDSDALQSIADGDSVTGSELERATQHIATLCGHPFGLNALLGSN